MLEVRGFTGELAWEEGGVCNTDRLDPGIPNSELFFLEGTPRGAERERRKAIAKAACQRCPIQKRCLQFAIDNTYEDGIWGGMTHFERVSIKYPRARVGGKLVYLHKLEEPALEESSTS